VPVIYYGVTAVDAQGTESRIALAPGSAMPLPPVIASPTLDAVVDASSIQVAGLAQPGVTVEISTGVAGGTLTSTVVGVDRRYSATLHLPNGPFMLAARARSAVTGLVSAPAFVTVTVIDFPRPPANLAAQPGDTTVLLTWDASPLPDVTGYNLYRDGSPRPLNVAPLPAGQTSYRDIALTNNRPYRYRITSVHQSGPESLASEEAAATPRAGAGWGNP
jgi:fibronectin type 3 domain-containing protein